MFFVPKLYKGTARGQKHGKRTKVDINMKAGRFVRNPPAFYLFVFSNGKKSFSEFFVRVLGDFIESLKAVSETNQILPFLYLSYLIGSDCIP